MNFPTDDLSTWVLATTTAIAGYFIRELRSDVSGLKQSLSDYKTHVAENYTTNKDFSELAKDIRDDLRLILNKLDNKEDKRNGI